MFLGLGGPVTPGVGAVVASSPLILGVLEHLRVQLPLGVVGLGVEPAPKVCLGYILGVSEHLEFWLLLHVGGVGAPGLLGCRFKLEGTCATGCSGRAPGCGSQHTYSDSQPSVTPILGDPTPSSDHHRHQERVLCTYTHTSKALMHVK